MTGEKKVALVTGGSRGIGFGIAAALADSGFDIAVNGRRDSAQVAEAVGKLQAAGTKVMYFRADIADRPARAAMLLEIEQNFGRLDVLVNNAGVASDERADLLNATDESFDRLIAVNLKGPYFLTQSVARWMARQRQAQGQSWRGCIINISSANATMASADHGDYCIASAGIAMATQLWAARLAQFGIDVYEILRRHRGHGHDRRRQGKIRPAHRRRFDPGKSLGNAAGTSDAPPPSWPGAKSPTPPDRFCASMAG